MAFVNSPWKALWAFDAEPIPPYFVVSGKAWKSLLREYYIYIY